MNRSKSLKPSSSDKKKIKLNDRVVLANDLGAEYFDGEEAWELLNYLLDMIRDDKSLDILSSVKNEGKTVRELSKELDIPLSTCFRKIRELIEASLLEIEKKNRGFRSEKAPEVQVF